MAKKQKVGGSMCHNFVLVYLSNISFYVYSRTTNIPFSDVSHIKFSLFTVCSVAISILDSPISEGTSSAL